MIGYYCSIVIIGFGVSVCVSLGITVKVGVIVLEGITGRVNVGVWGFPVTSK